MPLNSISYIVFKIPVNNILREGVLTLKGKAVAQCNGTYRHFLVYMFLKECNLQLSFRNADNF